MGFRVQGLGFRVEGSGFRAQGLGFRVQCLEYGFRFNQERGGRDYTGACMEADAAGEKRPDLCLHVREHLIQIQRSDTSSCEGPGLDPAFGYG